jgi:hypothetical protein
MTSWGTTQYPDDPYNYERDLSEAVSDYVCDMFSSTSKYYPCDDNWGGDTQPATVYYYTDLCEEICDYSLVIYKGHFWQASSVGDCGMYGCNVLHWGVVDYRGYVAYPPYVYPIKDYELHSNVVDGKTDACRTRGNHDFVFLWSCINADGDNNQVGGISGDHSWGMLASWMDIDDPNSELEEYGYQYPDYSDHVFTGFTWLSPGYMFYGQEPNTNLGQFVYVFFQTLLQGHHVNYALDAASDFINDLNFGSSNLYNDQSVWNPHTSQWEATQMRVWGDGYTRIPR